jgi:hypothetical protein
MRKSSTWFLKGVILLLGAAVLALCLFGLPRVIGEINLGGYDPILLGMYVTAIPFFIALYQALLLLRYIDKNNAFSELSVRALKKIKYCALAISGLYAVGLHYIFYVADLDDAPGVVAIALVIIFASGVIAIFAALLAKLLQNAIAIKSENDLTV